MGKTTNETLKKMRDENFSIFWHETLEMSRSLEIEEPKLPRKRKLPSKLNDFETENKKPKTKGGKKMQKNSSKAEHESETALEETLPLFPPDNEENNMLFAT